MERAEASGFSALVLTVDAPMVGRRLDDIRNRFSLPPHLNMANFAGMGDLENKAGESEEGKSGINEYVASLFDQGRLIIRQARLRGRRQSQLFFLLPPLLRLGREKTENADTAMEGRSVAEVYHEIAYYPQGDFTS